MKAKVTWGVAALVAVLLSEWVANDGNTTEIISVPLCVYIQKMVVFDSVVTTISIPKTFVKVVTL